MNKQVSTRRLTVKGNRWSITTIGSLAFVVVLTLINGFGKDYNGFLYMSSLAASSSWMNSAANESSSKTTLMKAALPLLCPIDQLFSGKWINRTYDRPPYIPARGEVQQKTCRDFNADQAAFRTYQWQPDAATNQDCIFAEFTKESYCQIMTNKTVAIIGDSISYDHFLSLTHLLGVPQSLPKAMRRTALQVSHVCSPQNTSLLIGKRDFYLQSVGDVTQQFFPDVLVLNRGAHFVDDASLLGDLNSTILPQVQEWQERCRLANKECHFVWRTSVPGHPDCHSFQEPSTSIAEMEELVRNHSTATGYHWDQFQHQNKLVVELLRQTTNIEYSIMDGYPVQILRPDLHKGHKGDDCLHTCLPDDNTYSWLLHHMLLLKYRGS